jgi:hypothetical protein
MAEVCVTEYVSATSNESMAHKVWGRETSGSERSAAATGGHAQRAEGGGEHATRSRQQLHRSRQQQREGIPALMTQLVGPPVAVGSDQTAHGW